MSQLNIDNIKNKKGDFGPTLVGHSTVTGNLNVTGGNLNVTGTISGDASGLTGIPTAVIATGNLTVNGPSVFNGTVNTNSVVHTNSTVNVDQGLIVTGTGASFRDNVKLNIGTGNDLEIYHDESNSFIKDVGTGSLYVQTDGPGVVIQKTDSENIAVFNSDSSVDLYHDGNKKFETRTDGAQVTGTIISDSVSSGSATFTGDVSIGGTLTYEDVTNIDSVGLVTARNGINVLSGGLAVTGIATFNDDIVGDNSTNISGINSVTATTFYGDGSGLTNISGGGGGGGASAVSSINDGANGRLDTFGTGQFAVFTSPGTFDATGITSVRARVVGAGSSGCSIQYKRCGRQCGYTCRTGPGCCFKCCQFQWVELVTSGTGGGAGGGYAHKVFDTPEIPGPGVFDVQIGEPWNCACTPTVGTSCFGSSLIATGGIGCCGGSGSGGDVNSTGGSPGERVAGGAAGSQLGPGNCAGNCSCGNIVNVPSNEKDYNSFSHWGIGRFPFDIFTGYSGKFDTTQRGCSGGGGGTYTVANPGCSPSTTGCSCIVCYPSPTAPWCVTKYTYCTFPNSALCGPDYISLSAKACASSQSTAGEGGHGGGGASGSIFCSPTAIPGYPVGYMCTLQGSGAGGKGGYGGGGGGVIDYCQYCYQPGPPSQPWAAVNYSWDSPAIGGAGAGGPGIVIVEW